MIKLGRDAETKWSNPSFIKLATVILSEKKTSKILSK